MGTTPDPGDAEVAAATPPKPSRRQRRQDKSAHKATRAPDTSSRDHDTVPGDGHHTVPGDDPGALPDTPRARSEAPAQLRALLVAGHPRQSLLTGVLVGVAALVSGRPLREGLVAGLAVFAVQAILGLLNDVTDRERDAAAGATGNPVADGRLPAGNASFAAVCLTLLAIPLSLQNGTVAGVALLLTLVSGFGYERWLRRTALSWLPWAVSYALLPAFLSYGGWGGGRHGAPPTWAMTGLAALLGIGVHFLTSLPDLVADNRAGVRHLPLRIALKLGATRLLVISVAWTVLVVAGIVVAGMSVGLRQ